MMHQPDTATMPLMIQPKKKRHFFEILTDLLRCAHHVAPFYSLDYLTVVNRAIHLRYQKGYAIQEAMELGLLNPGFPDADLHRCVSKREMVGIQRSLNPSSFEFLTGDKGVFYRYCTSLGLPVPKLYALYMHNAAGYTASGNLLVSSTQWRDYFERELPSEFVVKPARGLYGKGFLSIERNDEKGFVDLSSKRSYTAEDICHMMSSTGMNYVIQERLKNHPDLVDLSGTRNLQTLRVWTYVDRNRDSHILKAYLKAIVNNNVTDNHDHGFSGNLCASIDIDSGILQAARRVSQSPPGLITINSHPDTGIQFEGFRIPFWNAARDLAKSVSLQFLPMRLFGWDIAITPGGPRVVEGNSFADPPNHQKNVRHMLAVIYEDLEAADTPGKENPFEPS